MGLYLPLLTVFLTLFPLQSDCQNYYKVLLMLSDNDLMTCGTWGFAPKCDVRSVSLGLLFASFRNTMGIQ